MEVVDVVEVEVAVAVAPIITVPETVPEALTVDVYSCPALTVEVTVT